MTNRLRLLNHRANRLNRPIRDRFGIIRTTGKVVKIGEADLMYQAVWFNNKKTWVLASNLTILDNPEEGD